MAYETRFEQYVFSDDRQRLNIDAIHRYLSSESYWARNIPRTLVQEALDHSLCFGCYTSDGAQVGFARAITDYATYAWLSDVFIVPTHRGQGLGKQLVRSLLAHPRLQGLRRIALGTQDAHGLYSQFGFVPLADPSRHMEKRLLESYPGTNDSDTTST